MSNTKDTQGDLWEVFIQSKPGLSHKHVGSIHAMGKEKTRYNYMV